MGTFNYTDVSPGGRVIPQEVKTVTVIVVGGGGGGGEPWNWTGNIGQAGGATTLNTTGLSAGGGGGGRMTFGGGGGSGNYSRGSNGTQTTGFLVPRASSGYGPFGSGGAGASIASSGSNPQTYGGGGGGASRAVYSRGQNGAIPGQVISWSIGSGGAQGGSGSRRFGDPGAVYTTIETYDPPTISFSTNRTSIVRGGTARLSWSVSNSTSVSINQNIGTVSTSGSVDVSPQNTTIYTLSASNPAYTRTANVTITVYQPPVVTFSLDRNPIVRGESTTLRWTTTGDASSASVDNGIGNVPINGNTTVTPTSDTTYTISVSGLGGSDTDQITLTVYQPPSVDLVGPQSINYNENVILTYSATNAVTSVKITPNYTYKTYSQLGSDITLTPGVNISGNVLTTPSYNNFGPVGISYTIYVVGYGGLTASDSISFPVIIDETPDNIIIPDSDDKTKNEEPVISPDEVVTSYQVQVNDIDIPVEVKSNRPIQVELDNDDNWRNLRSI